MNRLETLFSQLQILELKYQKIEEHAINTFNIFSILRKADDEVHLHSRFLYELLNPQGSHQQGDRFLKLFIREIGIELPHNDIKIYKEKLNIDLLILSKPKAIIIENKIHTHDHSHQLSHYLEKVKNLGYKEENINLIYLTLFDEVPREKAIRDKVINITYHEHIRTWLSASIKEVALLPTLRETLVQYLNLINRLTHQTHHKGFTLEVKEFLLQENHLQTALNISDAIIEAKIDIQLNFWKTLIRNLQEHYPFEFTNYYGDKNIQKSVNKYYKKQKNRKEYGYEYQVDENLYFFIEIKNNIYYGFYFPDKNQIKEEQMERLNRIKASWEDGNYWKYPNKQLNFEKFNTPNVLDLINPEQREKDIKIISDEIIDLIQQYQGVLVC